MSVFSFPKSEYFPYYWLLPFTVKTCTWQVNIIVATPILEEGLDVQSCNLVICFDPPKTFCSFIQCRGRARTHNSDFIIMVER